MESYNEVKSKELEVTKDYSNKKLNKYIMSCKLLNTFMFNEVFIWIVSLITFAIIPSIFILLGFFDLDSLTIWMFGITHFIYWIFVGSKGCKKLIDDTKPELELSIEVLEDIRKERNNG
jgi:hypothetical protein